MNTIQLNISKAKQSKSQSFDFDNFTFGIQPTDHIFLCNYRAGSWEFPRIEKFQNLSISPFALCFHYGQTVFEGMKAFRQDDGRVHIFRPDKHFHRLNKSLERMCMPVIDEALFHSALSELIRLEQSWLPRNNDISLYIRPFVIATEPRLGVKVSDEYLFAVVCSPLAAYYAEPLRVKIETQYVRASEGGAGYAKCGGNYGAAFYPTQKAKEEGYDQIIWTDAKTHTFLEEAGTMNIMVIRDNKLITPLSGETILEGVTKNSIIHIAKGLGIEVEERSISYNELVEAFTNEENVEIFGCGTAAVVSPIKCVNINGTDYYLYIKEDALMFKLKTVLDDIRKGRHHDTFGWNYFV